jgi:hypothetical protein
MRADSLMDEFSEGSRTDGQAFDQPAVAFDGITFTLLDGGAIATGFASESRGLLRLRRVIIWMGTLRFICSIQSTAFSSSSFTSIIIPRTVDIISSYCFYCCQSLSSVLIEPGSLLRRIESFAFSNSSLRLIVIPRTVEIINGSAFSSCERFSISIEEGSKHLVVDDSFLQSFDRSILIRYFGREDIFCIPQTVDIIGSYCFYCCRSLSSVLIESSSLLRRIESFAFSNSSLRSIIIPRTVEIIDSYCFYCCNFLSSVLIESSSLLRRIESFAFSNSSLTSIIIPRTVEIIGSYCFSGCRSLSSVLIESGSLLQRIESDAFSFTKLISVCLPVDVQSIGANVFPRFCEVLRM